MIVEMNNNSGSASVSAVANAGAGKNKTKKSIRRNATTKAENNVRELEELIVKRNAGKYKGKKNLNALLAAAIAKRNTLRATKGPVNALTRERNEAKAVGKKLYAEIATLSKGAEKEGKKMEYLAVKAKVDDLEARIREAKGLTSVAKNTTKKATNKVSLPSTEEMLTLTNEQIHARVMAYAKSIKKGAENSSRVKAAKGAAAEIKKAAAEMRDACKKECEERYKIEKAKAEEIVEKAKRNNA
jgi:hypothetical protein